MILNLQKDKSIKKVITELFNRFGESNFYLTDNWDADLCAVGIKNSKDGENLVYISTWKVKNNHYFVEVEDLTGEVILNGNKNDEINFEELSEIIKEYLYLQLIYV